MYIYLQGKVVNIPTIKEHYLSDLLPEGGDGDEFFNLPIADEIETRLDNNMYRALGCEEWYPFETRKEMVNAFRDEIRELTDELQSRIYDFIQVSQ
jgi:hypothetical protein